MQDSNTFLSLYPEHVDMSRESVHIIPVGFDFQRLVKPFTSGDTKIDRAIIIGSNKNSGEDAAEEMANRMISLIESQIKLNDAKVENENFKNLHNYENIFETSYKLIKEELDSGNELWINISSMPRTVAFALATAANTCSAEFPEYRDDIHIIYVSVNEYFALDMKEELEKVRDTINALEEVPESLEERFNSIDHLLYNIDSNGMTADPKKIEGKSYLEIDSIPQPNLKEFEKRLLKFLNDNGSYDSTSKLADELFVLVHTNENNKESFRSRVQYNVQKLDKKGYIDRKEKDGRNYETKISTMGELWIRTHEMN